MEYKYIECPHCKEAIREDASKCPHCRSVLYTEEKNQYERELKLVVFFSFVVSFFILNYLTINLYKYMDWGFNEFDIIYLIVIYIFMTYKIGSFFDKKIKKRIYEKYPKVYVDIKK